MPTICSTSAIASVTERPPNPSMKTTSTLLRSLMIGLAACIVLAMLAMAAGLFTPVPLDLPLVFAVAILVGLMHWWKSGVVRRIGEFQAEVRQGLQRLGDRLAEAQGLVQLVPYERPYPLPFGGGWALTADAAALLAREVALSRPQVIVELGSGVSTLLLARMFKEMGGGKVYSLDHDAGWAEYTRRHLTASGVADYAKVFDAPLSRQRFGADEYEWYTVPEAVQQLGSIDFLIVDGPPAALNPAGMPRYPAFPAFIRQLSPQAVVYVDDAKRPQEQAMIERWLRENPGFEGRMHDTVPGTYLLRRKV